MPPPTRMAWIDNLRTLMIVLVVNMHACVTYSHVGGWYLYEEPGPSPPVKIAFIFWQAHLQSFFMGLLFFVAGSFSRVSLSRRGPGNFVRERFRRLGLPSFLYMLVIQPFIVYVLLQMPALKDRPSLAVLYRDYLLHGRVLSGSGPMWFALALLIFSVILAGMRAGHPKKGEPMSPRRKAPGVGALLLFGLLLVFGTFLVRLVQPLGTDFFNFQLGFFVQYIAAFWAGTKAARHGWMESLARSRHARVAGWCGVLGGPILLAGLLLLGGPPPDEGIGPYSGGWNLHALGLAAWEQLTGLCLGLGLLACAHRHADISSRVAVWLSQRSFAVYVWHAPVLVGLTLVFRPLALPSLMGAALLTVTGLMASFILADAVLRIPGFKSIM